MEELYLDFQERSYSIYFKQDFEVLQELFMKKNAWSKVLIVTDSTVDSFYGEQVRCLVEETGRQVFKFAFQAGEQSKHLQTIQEIYDMCINHRLDRGSMIIALGGGVTGDMAGFAAATYMRGISFIQVPTSLLAQVDSSVGGKVGVDYKGTKNIIGAFHQPAWVYININTLKTLPQREFVSGLAEVIKHGVIYDRAFFNDLEENMDKILALDPEILQIVVRKNCEIKAQVVQQDEREQGLRAILNFGHTIGHAIESVRNFSLLHGECVALGMAAAGAIARKMGIFPSEAYDRMVKLLDRAGLPTELEGLEAEEIYAEMLKDKKQTDNRLKFILPVGIGEVIQSTEVTKEMIVNILK